MSLDGKYFKNVKKYVEKLAANRTLLYIAVLATIISDRVEGGSVRKIVRPPDTAARFYEPLIFYRRKQS